MNQPPHLIEGSGVTLSFGARRIFSDLSFQVNRGEVVLLLGDNGAGKTSLLNIVSGYTRPSSGSITYHLRGASLTSPVEPEKLARLGIGRLWQEIRLFPEMSVLDNVLAATPSLARTGPLSAVWDAMTRRNHREPIEDAERNLSIVGMDGRLASSCDMLSVGQMKRVALARLFQMGAELLLLDEPLSGLDRRSCSSMAETIRDLSKKHGKGVLIVEHRHDIARPVADRVWRLQDGQLAAEGTT